MRILIAGILGGIVMFLWGAVAHMALPVGEMGMKVSANQDAAIVSLQAAADQGGGVYMLPGLSPDKWKDKAAMEAFQEKARNSPYAFVVYQPGGNPVNLDMTPNLIKQFASDTLSALVIAWILALGAWAFSRRVLVAIAVGVFAWLAISVPYWNWYMFPTDFTVGSLIEQAVGSALAGAAIAWWLGRAERRPA